MEDFRSDEPGVFQLAGANGPIDSFRDEIKHAIGYDEINSHWRTRLNVGDEGTTHHTSYSMSQRKRKQVDEIFGWMKMGQFLLPKCAPHPNEPKLFINYVLSAEGQQLLAKMGREVARRGITIKHPRLLHGVKVQNAKSES